MIYKNQKIMKFVILIFSLIFFSVFSVSSVVKCFYNNSLLTSDNTWLR
jgi:hypothetical protein